MPLKQMFLIRRARTGHQFTVVSTSKKSAMRDFFLKNRGAEVGEDFKIKTREVEEPWETYRFKGGIDFRKIPG